MLTGEFYMSAPMIQVNNLVKRYGDSEVLHSVSFTIEKGEVVGFLGPNGAGKTTTMRILTGYIPATAGEVTIAGLSVQDNPLDIRRKIGYLPENVPLYNEMTVEAYLRLMGELKGIDGVKLQNGVTEVMESCSIIKMRNRVIDTLSKGYRQRVGIAQALLGDPDILILDEPTVGLDPNQIIEIRSLIKDLGKERTVILSTHILPEVSQTCSRILIINNGTLVAQGTPEELTAKINTKTILTIKVLGNDEDGLEKVLSAVSKDIVKVACDHSGETTIASVEVATDKELRPEIAKALIKGKYDLLELHAETLGLEELFLQLTQ